MSEDHDSWKITIKISLPRIDGTYYPGITRVSCQSTPEQSEMALDVMGTHLLRETIKRAVKHHVLLRKQGK